ncbi:AMP-binding protein [Candidatus Gracilibacteria bacterium]|nr:AMP-binding protein [Candidatus Gracilibacteria bacterium]
MGTDGLSYVSGTSTKPLLGTTIGALFDQIVERFPDNEALVARQQSQRFSYAQLHQAVERCARGLLAIGLGKGERIGIWSPNRVEWTIAQFATAKIGAILVNINPAYRLHELEYVLVQAGCSALIIAPAFKTSNYTQMLYDLAPELHHAAPGPARCGKAARSTHADPAQPRAKPRHVQLGGRAAARGGSTSAELHARQRRLQFDEAINIQYTSGTTGFPKGATLSHHNILNNGYFVAEVMGFTDQDRLVIPVPLYHCFGMVMGNLGCVTHGATMIYPSEGFDARAVLEAVQEERATALFGVPTMFIAELEHPEFAHFDLRSLRTGVMAGSPCPIEVMKKVQTAMHMRDVEICYGMTETSPVSFQTRIGAPLEKQVGTVGQIHPHVEVKIVDPESGEVVPIGSPGELCTRGYSVMLGYWNNHEATQKAIDTARWMHTGDLAVMDDEGYVNIVGRIKDMIIRGGENIYPREIEEFLYTHPSISDVQVIGVPDARYGEEIMAWVKLKAGAQLDITALRAFCRDQIAHYKIPRYLKVVDSFPMTVTGKIQKYLMREQSIRELQLEAADLATA